MNRIEFGDCRDTMRRWAAEGVRAQMCVTSPPYFGLRDYGHPGQLGLEQTPEQYVAAMVEVFRCVRDVLADDGTLWLNIGDSYARDPGKGGSGPGGKNTAYSDTYTDPARIRSEAKGSSDGKVGRADRAPVRVGGEGIKPKDLIGIPWLLAFALRADGWYLRQDIIWQKPNPMPESVTDRCTKAHEYVFLLSKSERYYFDSAAMKEEAVRGHAGSDFRKGKTAIHQENRVSQAERVDDGKRNRRSVWTVATRPYKGAHFATYPPELIEPCILAGSRPGDIVLDPFMGSGTTAQVSRWLGRQYLGCELNPEYEPLQQQRIATPRGGSPAPRPADAAQVDLFSHAPTGAISQPTEQI